VEELGDVLVEFVVEDFDVGEFFAEDPEFVAAEASYGVADAD
jgi:hypothetical protein